MTKQEFDNISKNIFPVMKVKVESSQEKPTGTSTIKLTHADTPVKLDLFGDLFCAYGIDQGTYFSLILNKMLPQEVNLEEITELALGNVFDAYDPAILRLEDGVMSLDCGGEYEAALIIGGVWDQLVADLGKDITFIVPAKHEVYFTASDNEPGKGRLREILEEVHERGENLLSKKMFRYIDDEGIEVVA
jgi:hypothetical protein